MKKVIGLAALLATLVSVTACGTQPAKTNNAAGGNSSVTAQSGGTSTNGPWVIAQSNSYYGNGARIQMKEEIQAIAKTAPYNNLVKKVIINNAGNDVAAQINAIDNMIAQHVNAILIDAASPTGLNGVIKQAHDQGIVVVSYDNLVTSPYAYKVDENMGTYAQKGITWLVDQLHGKGNIVVLRGVSGTTDDQEEWKAVQQVVKANPGIHVLNVSYANWDEATAQKTMANLLATYPNINGVYTEGGEAQGVVQAYIQANKPFVPVVGSDSNGFAKLLVQYKSHGLTGIQVSSDLWRSAKAFEVAVDVLKGKQVPKYTALPVVNWTSNQVSQYVLQNQPDSLSLGVDDPQAGVTLTPQQVLAQH